MTVRRSSDHSTLSWLLGTPFNHLTPFWHSAAHSLLNTLCPVDCLAYYWPLFAFMTTLCPRRYPVLPWMSIEVLTSEIFLTTEHPHGCPSLPQPLTAPLLFGAILAHRRPLLVCRLTVNRSPLGCSARSYSLGAPDWLPTSSAFSVLLAARHPDIEPPCLLCACCACVYSFHSEHPYEWGIVNIGEKVRSTFGMRYCQKCYVKYRGENVCSLEALLTPRGKSVTTRQIPQVERARQSHCCLANTPTTRHLCLA